jgi:cystathionine beta-lyase
MLTGTARRCDAAAVMTDDFDRVVERRGTDSNKWHKFGPDVLPLWVADMDFRSPEPVIAALRARVEHGVFGYLREGWAELVEVFTEHCRKRYRWEVPPEAVILMPGVTPGNNVAARVLCSRGDGLVILTPIYPPILRIPDNAGLDARLAALARRADGRYEADLGAFERVITPRTRAFVLCNPHNPVGRVYTRGELERLAEACLRRGLAIVADEVHCDLVYPGHEHVPIASLAPEVADRTITLMSPSKTFNLAGLKASVGVVTNAALRERFLAARADMVQIGNVLGYTAMVAAYRDGGPWHAALLRYLEANRDFLADYVKRHLPGVTMAPPEGTYLAWLDCRATGIADPWTFFLEQAKVALNDGKLFGAPGAGFVRLNFGTPRPILTDGLERMRRALAVR